MGLFSRAEKAPQKVPLPTVIPALCGTTVGAAYGAARTGGDFFEFLHLADRVLLIAMFDIAGKRAEALGVAATIQQLLRTRAQSCIECSGNVNDALSSLVLELNRGIIKAVGVHNCPAFIAALEEETSILSYINAGHTPALLKDSDGIEELGAGGVPLGLFSHVVHDASMTVIEEGAVLLIPSRGILEAKSGSREFGIEGVRNELLRAEYATASELTDRVVRAAEAFLEAPGFWGPRIPIPGFSDAEPNDMTAVALARPAARASAAAS
ncbi:MAG: SpoIIE family protein phosphatase [Acidobacteriales bacterium]|nr:SpoIIE family protein phosphatase [Terriglobales bacterium]